MSESIDLSLQCEELHKASTASGVALVARSTGILPLIVNYEGYQERIDAFDLPNTLLIPMIECVTDLGDFLVISPHDIPCPSALMHFQDAVDGGWMQDTNAVIWLHPYRGGRASRFEDAQAYGLEKLMQHIDAIQLNGRDLLSCPELNQKAERLALEWGKPIVGGSENATDVSAHLMMTEFEPAVTSRQSLIAAIKSGNVKVTVDETRLANVLAHFALRFCVS